MHLHTFFLVLLLHLHHHELIVMEEDVFFHIHFFHIQWYNLWCWRLLRLINFRVQNGGCHLRQLGVGLNFMQSPWALIPSLDRRTPDIVLVISIFLVLVFTLFILLNTRSQSTFEWESDKFSRASLGKYLKTFSSRSFFQIQKKKPKCIIFSDI